MRVFLCLCMMLWPVLGQAGAWQREVGQLFVATGTTLKLPRETKVPEPEFSLHAEYGFRPNLTFGLSHFRKQDGSGQSYGFLRLPLRDFGNFGRVAAEFGLGVKQDAAASAPMGVVGLSWGRGLEFRERNGWVSVEANALIAQSRDPVFKLDGTVGWSISDRAKLLGQLFYERDGDASTLTVSPGFVRSLPKMKTDLVLGLAWQRDAVGLRMGFWRKF